MKINIGADEVGVRAYSDTLNDGSHMVAVENKKVEEPGSYGLKIKRKHNKYRRRVYSRRALALCRFGVTVFRIDSCRPSEQTLFATNTPNDNDRRVRKVKRSRPRTISGTGCCRCVGGDGQVSSRELELDQQGLTLNLKLRECWRLSQQMER
ncbi:hypothetical protein EVAR_20182_1 [Eumeta japonica]|uniref:Uncharacterized protein n=1 Tax=Eumeta variegata TaxID=151549 RepID=A0A4C1UTN9_EUMVA|nr:hypothetical protein EVAR_20182_1 [Eumeta japonica]